MIMKRTTTIILSSLVTLLIISCHKEQGISNAIVRSTGIDSANNSSNNNCMDTINNNDKDTISTTATIFGRWSIVSDCLYIADAPPFFKTSDSIYVGVAADYYDFGQDGRLYRTENNHTDTCSFEVLSGYQVEFDNVYDYSLLMDSLGILKPSKPNKTYSIINLTEHNLTLVSTLTGSILTPEGYFANTLKLKK
jgi:hypothetical protein